MVVPLHLVDKEMDKHYGEYMKLFDHQGHFLPQVRQYISFMSSVHSSFAVDNVWIG